MDFALSDEQQMLRDASRDLLADRYSPTQLRASIDTEPADDVAAQRVWELGSELGWPGLALPEEHGGSGQGLVELALVAEELGRAAARTPFLPTVLVGAAVVRGGSAELQAEVLPGLTDGTQTAAWASVEAGRGWELSDVRATATADGDAFLLQGSKSLVQDAAGARWLLVTAQLDGEPSLFLVDLSTTPATPRRQQVYDLTRPFYAVDLAGLRARRLDLSPRQVQGLADMAAVLTAADALGAGHHLFGRTIDYAKVRVQFGRAIGSFQATKQKAATMRIQLLAAHAAVYAAAMAIDASTADAGYAASTAKAYVSEAITHLSGEALQIHGGIGFTWEHDLHVYLRRIKTDQSLYGDAATHHDRLVTLLEQQVTTPV